MSYSKILFEKYDTNKDLKLQIDEVEKSLIDLGKSYTKQEIAILIKAFDENDNGALEFEEFDQLCYAVEQIGSMQLEEVLFYRADKDRNGTIDQDEYLDLMTKMKLQYSKEQLLKFAKGICGDDVEIEPEQFKTIVRTIKSATK
ncbi:Calmodulin [Hexamita inflata]|uniref:Calmodulin n=1 Tax=Hexamita inflata TaxID=28002 RepID=A0ABP1GX90_9EUKA